MLEPLLPLNDNDLGRLAAYRLDRLHHLYPEVGSAVLHIDLDGNLLIHVESDRQVDSINSVSKHLIYDAWLICSAAQIKIYCRMQLVQELCVSNTLELISSKTEKLEQNMVAIAEKNQVSRTDDDAQKPELTHSVSGFARQLGWTVEQLYTTLDQHGIRPVSFTDADRVDEQTATQIIDRIILPMQRDALLQNAAMNGGSINMGAIATTPETDVQPEAIAPISEEDIEAMTESSDENSDELPTRMSGFEISLSSRPKTVFERMFEALGLTEEPEKQKAVLRAIANRTELGETYLARYYKALPTRIEPKNGAEPRKVSAEERRSRVEKLVAAAEKAL